MCVEAMRAAAVVGGAPAGWGCALASLLLIWSWRAGGGALLLVAGGPPPGPGAWCEGGLQPKEEVKANLF